MDDLLSSIRKLIGEDEPKAHCAGGEDVMPSPRLNRRIKPSDPLPEIVENSLREALANADRAIASEADAPRVRRFAGGAPRMSASDRAAAERTRDALLQAIDQCGADETLPDDPVTYEGEFPFERPNVALSLGHPEEMEGVDAVLPPPVWLPGAYTNGREDEAVWHRRGADAVHPEPGEPVLIGCERSGKPVAGGLRGPEFRRGSVPMASGVPSSLEDARDIGAAVNDHSAEGEASAFAGPSAPATVGSRETSGESEHATSATGPGADRSGAGAALADAGTAITAPEEDLGAREGCIEAVAASDTPEADPAPAVWAGEAHNAVDGAADAAFGRSSGAPAYDADPTDDGVDDMTMLHAEREPSFSGPDNVGGSPSTTATPLDGTLDPEARRSLTAERLALALRPALLTIDDEFEATNQATTADAPNRTGQSRDARSESRLREARPQSGRPDPACTRDGSSRHDGQHLARADRTPAHGPRTSHGPVDEHRAAALREASALGPTPTEEDGVRRKGRCDRRQTTPWSNALEAWPDLKQSNRRASADGDAARGEEAGAADPAGASPERAVTGWPDCRSASARAAYHRWSDVPPPPDAPPPQRHPSTEKPARRSPHGSPQRTAEGSPRVRLDGGQSRTSGLDPSHPSQDAALVRRTPVGMRRTNEHVAGGGDDLMSEATRIATGAAFEELARSMAPPCAEGGTDPARGRAEAVEALVKDAVRPLLREWIDANLQTIVERVVREEIARMTKGR